MKKLSLFFVVIGLTSYSCPDRTSTSFQTEFTNNSGHTIAITPYLFGTIITVQIITLAPAEQKTIYQDEERGFSKGFCYGNGVVADSFVVTYDGSYMMAHYTYGLTTTNPKSYSFNSPRNIRNADNYQFISDDHKRHRDVRYLFTFTAQDYIDASN